MTSSLKKETERADAYQSKAVSYEQEIEALNDNFRMAANVETDEIGRLKQLLNAKDDEACLMKNRLATITSELECLNALREDHKECQKTVDSLQRKLQRLITERSPEDINRERGASTGLSAYPYTPHPCHCTTRSTSQARRILLWIWCPKTLRQC